MTPEERSIREYLDEMMGTQGITRDVAARVAAEGVFYPSPARARPRGMRKMADKSCYRNAAIRAVQEGWTYCEGIAVSRGFPVQP